MVKHGEALSNENETSNIRFKWQITTLKNKLNQTEGERVFGMGGRAGWTTVGKGSWAAHWVACHWCCREEVG